MRGLSSIRKKSSVLLPILLQSIQSLLYKDFLAKMAKVEFSHLRISVNINVQIYMYYLKQYSCSLTTSLSTKFHSLD